MFFLFSFSELKTDSDHAAARESGDGSERQAGDAGNFLAGIEEVS
jgi:hypothetical protein